MPTDTKKPGFRWCYQPGGFDNTVPEGFTKDDYRREARVPEQMNKRPRKKIEP